MTTLEEKFQFVHTRIHNACKMARRDPGKITLLVVSKTQQPQDIGLVYELGQRAFGENYVQEAVEKQAQLQDRHGLIWHCIGPVQSNKTRLVAEHFDWVHSIDRLKTAQRLAQQRPEGFPALNVCIQVNIDQAASKSGIAPQDALTLGRAIGEQLPNLNLRGIMTVPDPQSSEKMRCAHANARALFEHMRQQLTQDDQRLGNRRFDSFDTLSMGMSDDLEQAILEGSTLVRVGSAIFGARPVKVKAQGESGTEVAQMPPKRSN